MIRRHRNSFHMQRDHLQHAGPTFYNHPKHKASSFNDNCFIFLLKDEHFINAKYRLLVRSHNDPYASLQDPNKNLPWDEIQAVISSQPEPLECPICLYPPVAPRMERCGHVYCFPCLIQYIANGDHRSSRKCAICDYEINLSHLKRVALNPLEVPTVGKTVSLDLLRKRKNFPKITICRPETSPPAEKECFRQRKFERIVVASDNELLLIVNEELDNLLSHLAVSQVDDLSFEIIPFLKSCLRSVRNEQSELYTRIKRSNTLPLNVNDLKLEDENDENSMLFYQLSDGQDAYLCGLNWRCLNAQFPELPQRIEAPIVDVKKCVLTPSNRKTLRYLSHLPDGREVMLIELDLTHLLSEEILKRFATEIEAHENHRESQKEMDRELTRLKIQQENRYQNMAAGFRLLGNVNFQEEMIPTAADFMPLSPQSTESRPAQSSPSAAFQISFAAMTRAAASGQVYDGRPIPPPPVIGDGAAHHWPSLMSSSAVARTNADPTSRSNNNRRKKQRKKTASNGEESSSQ